MKILVTSQTHDSETFLPPHPCGQGLYHETAGLYLYTLLCDPYILALTKAMPCLCASVESIESSAETILFYSYPSPDQDISHIDEILQRGGKVLFNYPHENILARFEAPMQSDGLRQLLSLREKWDLGPSSGGRYFYPDRQPFYRLDANLGKVLSHIGDNPDLLVQDSAAWFAGDPFGAALSYINNPVFSELLFDLSNLLVQLTQHWLGATNESATMCSPPASHELRRDFHAFGFAYLTVIELARCYGESDLKLDEAAGAAIEGAREMAAGDEPGAEAQLRKAFLLLERETRRLQPRPAIFLDTLHGGGLFGDIGYFEFDWPQHSADVLRKYLGWAAGRSYRFNIDFAAQSVEGMAERFPRLQQELRRADGKGEVEFVNGTMNQSHPPYYGLESQIRQLDYGQAIFEKVIGHRVPVYASQEFGLTPQTPTLLAQYGYTNAVMRVQHLGRVPPVCAEHISWAAPNGDEIATLPSHPYCSEQQNSTTYNNLHLKIYAQQQSCCAYPVFTTFGDITYYRPFREELARICHYAPVFGHFSTWSAYFALPKEHPSEKLSFPMSQFEYPCFMELPLWHLHQEAMGNVNTHCMLSRRLSHVLCAAEMIDGISQLLQVTREGNAAVAKGWQALTVYQGHDNYLVPFHASGGFMGGVTNQGARQSGRASQTVVDYCGSWDSMTINERATHDAQNAEQEADGIIRRHLRALAPPGKDGYIVYSFGPAGHRVVCFVQARGAVLMLDGRELLSQEEGDHLLASIDLPANGWVWVEKVPSAATESGSAGVSVSKDFSMENDCLCVEFDASTGTIARLIRRDNGQDLLAPGSHHFHLPGLSSQTALAASVIANGPVRGVVEFLIEVRGESNERALIRSRVTLDVHQPLLHFEETVLECPEMRGDSWTYNLSLGIVPYAPGAKVKQAYFNVLEISGSRKLFSANLLALESAHYQMLLVNAGNEFYVRDGEEIRNILIFENEPGRCFSHWVGYTWRNPISEARSTAQPAFVEPINGGAANNEAPVAGMQQIQAGSLIEFDSDDIELLSCRYESGKYYLRLASLIGQAQESTLTFFLPVEESYRTDLLGVCRERLVSEHRKVEVPLKAWDIQQVEIRPVIAPDSIFNGCRVRKN